MNSTDNLMTSKGRLRKNIDRRILSDIQRENIERLMWVASLPVGYRFEFEGSTHHLTQEDRKRAQWTINNLRQQTI